jgi:hypothetical protein
VGGGQFTPPRTLQLDENTDYEVTLHADRITPDIMYKHNNWDGQVEEYKLTHLFNTGNPPNPIIKFANFHSPASVQLYNNFEEYAADGVLWFRDPWFVEQGGVQPDVLNDFPSPYIPTGKWDETDPAVFLKQERVLSKKVITGITVVDYQVKRFCASPLNNYTIFRDACPIWNRSSLIICFGTPIVRLKCDFMRVALNNIDILDQN